MSGKNQTQLGISKYHFFYYYKVSYLILILDHDRDRGGGDCDHGDLHFEKICLDLLITI